MLEYLYFPCDLLDLFKLADMVGDKGLVKKLLVWFGRTSDAKNITKRTFSARYQGDGLAPLQQTLRKIFITLWTEDNSVRENVGIFKLS